MLLYYLFAHTDSNRCIQLSARSYFLVVREFITPHFLTIILLPRESRMMGAISDASQENIPCQSVDSELSLSRAGVVREMCDILSHVFLHSGVWVASPILTSSLSTL